LRLEPENVHATGVVPDDGSRYTVTVMELIGLFPEFFIVMENSLVDDVFTRSIETICMFS